MEHRFVLALYLLIGPQIDPLAFGQIDRVAEDTDQQVIPKHVLINHIIHIAVIGIHQRHRAQHRHTGQMAIQRCRVDIGAQRMTQLDIITVHGPFVRRVIPRVQQAEPAIDLHPRQEGSHMQRSHLILC